MGGGFQLYLHIHKSWCKVKAILWHLLIWIIWRGKNIRSVSPASGTAIKKPSSNSIEDYEGNHRRLWLWKCGGVCMRNSFEDTLIRSQMVLKELAGYSTWTLKLLNSECVHKQSSGIGSAGERIRNIYFFLVCQRFVTDRSTWDVYKQFLWGPALLISPALDMVYTHTLTHLFELL